MAWDLLGPGNFLASAGQGPPGPWDLLASAGESDPVDVYVAS